MCEIIQNRIGKFLFFAIKEGACHIHIFIDRHFRWHVFFEQTVIDPTVDRLLDKNWPLHRLDATLRAIIRAGAYEIMFKENVPAKVAINEYVNVASAFFDKEEPALANAVLNALARARRPQEFQT